MTPAPFGFGGKEGDNKSANTPSRDAANTASASYSASEIKRALLADASQEIAVIVSLTTWILAVLYLLVLSPVLGERGLAVALVVLAGATTFLSMVLSYFVDFDQKYTRKALELLPLLDGELDRTAGEIGRLRRTLETGFADLTSTEGLRILSQLNQTYDGLQSTLDRNAATEALSMARIPALAEETYRQGLSILFDVLELLATIDVTTVEWLGREIRKLEQDIVIAKRDETEKERLRIWEETLDFHRERLDLVDRQRLTIEQLLHHAQSCEASLYRTGVEISALRADPAKSSVRVVTETLHKTIVQAKDVQEEIMRHRY